MNTALRSERERDTWIQLARSRTVLTFWRLLNKYKCAYEALLSLQGKAYSIVALCQEKEKVQQTGCDWLLYGDPNYPELLKTIPDAPPVFITKGNAKILRSPMISIVGARNCSVVGANFAYKTAQGIGNAGYVVVSGMARGIDTAANRGALET